MKVLFVSMTQASTKNAYNYRLLMLQQGLQRMGVQTDFLYMQDWIRPYLKNRIRRVPPVLYPIPFSNLLPQLRHYDVIHIGGAIAAFPFCLFRKHLPASLVHDIHGDGISEMLIKWKMEGRKLKNTYHLLQVLLLLQVAIHRADYHLVVSRFLLKQLLAHRVPRDRALMLRNGADINVFRPNGRPQKGPLTICYAGDFQVWQGLDNLVEAGRMLRDLDIKWKFVGFRQTQNDGEWKERIRKSLGHKAELVDRVSHEELIRHLQAADLLVSPRPYHTSSIAMFPCKFPEYIAMGKPVLVTDVGDTPQFVRASKCGLVCPPSARGLAEAIRQAHSMGRSELVVMGERGRRLAETTFDWKVICREYYDFLTRIKRS